MKISNVSIGKNHNPFIIAEMSANHNKSLERALKIIDKVKASGANAIKLQTYKAETMTLDLNDKEFFIDDKSSKWYGQSMFELYSKAHTPWLWHKDIFSYAEKKGLICFSSPFDESAVELLESLNTPAYKIASHECIDLPLIKCVSKTKKPIIISTGMATISEIAEAVDTARTFGCIDLALMKCTSTYPSSPENSNLRTIPHMRDLFNCEIGLSDHTLGIGAAIASISFGASIIEKHFTLSREDGGVDASFSLEPSEFSKLVEESKSAFQACGEIKYGPTNTELNARQRRRSIYISKNLKSGEKLNKENMKLIRPGLGLNPKYYEILLGKKVKKNVSKGTPVTWDLF